MKKYEMPTVVFTFDVMCLFDERKEAIFFKGRN